MAAGVSGIPSASALHTISWSMRGPDQDLIVSEHDPVVGRQDRSGRRPGRLSGVLLLR